MFSPCSLRTACAALVALTGTAFGEVRVEKLSGKVRVDIDYRLFTEVILTGAPHVYYYPIMGPGERPMTRAYPMEDVPGEERDHPHHRSMWFAHGMVNGVDFWTEPPRETARKPAKKLGKIVHDKVLEAKGGATEGVVTTSQTWVAPDESIPITSTQTLRVFQRPATEREFEFSTTLTAGEKDVVFGDTKEGTFAIRIAESMRLRQPKGEPGKGHIVNSEGLEDEKAWGARAKWVDMFGPVKESGVLGIAIFDHPSNLRHPTRWHARDYGLFAANPFCEHDMDSSLAQGTGDWTLAAGKSVTFRYRILIHQEAPNVDDLNQRFAEFSK